jgi:hypothetical protein
LIAHLWEVGQSWIDYYYFDENCAYHILGSIEAVRPQLNLTDSLPPYVIPIDVIRALRIHELLDEPTFRPSVKSALDNQLASLSAEQISRIRFWTDLNGQPPVVADEQDAAALDAALDTISYLYPYEVQLPSSDASRRKALLGRLRASLAVSSPSKEILHKPSELPHRAHKTSLLSIGGGYSKLDKSFSELRFRPVFHDLIDPTAGLPQYAEVKFFDFTFRWLWENQRLLLRDFTAFEVFSLTPWEKIYRPLSWHLRVGAQTTDDADCRNCLSATIEGGAGLSSRSLSLLLEGEGRLNPKLQNNTAGYFGIGPTAILRLPSTEGFGFLLKGLYRYRIMLKNDPHWSAIEMNARYQLSQDFSVIGRWGVFDNHPEGRLEVRYYF